MSDNMSELAAWYSFYAIIGPAAGALIGLQFVVLTLIAEGPQRPAPETGAAFATPTIVHFSTVLVLSALVGVPWPTITIAATVWTLLGLSGVAYAVITARRMRKQAHYKPDFEDWSFHCGLPLAAYALLTLSAVAAPAYPRAALFGIGAASLLLLVVSIHNAWDGVAYQVFVSRRTANLEQRKEETSEEKTPG
jgi:hypothetical protein